MSYSSGETQIVLKWWTTACDTYRVVTNPCVSWLQTPFRGLQLMLLAYLLMEKKGWKANYFLRWLFPMECHQRAVTHKHSAYHSLHVQPLQTPLAGATHIVREKPHDPPAGSFPLSKMQGERRKKNKRKQARQTQKAIQGWFLRKISPTLAAVVSNRCTQPQCYSRSRGKIDSFSGW